MICESRLQQIAHTVKFTKLANMITPKRSFIVQSRKLAMAYTRSYFNDSYKIKQNTTMNVNRSQKHGLILHYITQTKSRTTKITVTHHTLTHFNSNKPISQLRPRQGPITSQNKAISMKDDCSTFNRFVFVSWS